MVSCTHIRVFISSKMNLGKMYLTKKKKKNYIYRYIYLKHLLYKAFTLLQGLTWLWVLATYWIDQGETEAMNDVILGLEGRKMKLSQKKKKTELWVWDFDGGRIAFKQQGLYYQRGEQFTMTARAAVPSENSTHPFFFLFCFICHTTHPL